MSCVILLPQSYLASKTKYIYLFFNYVVLVQVVLVEQEIDKKHILFENGADKRENPLVKYLRKDYLSVASLCRKGRTVMYIIILRIIILL